MSKASGISRPTLYDWLDGKGSPQRDKVARVADALDVAFEVLWGEETELAPTERTRLMQLERFASRVRELLSALDAAGRQLQVAEDIVAPYDATPQDVEERPRTQKKRGRQAR